jgi:hypothetical protein
MGPWQRWQQGVSRSSSFDIRDGNRAHPALVAPFMMRCSDKGGPNRAPRVEGWGRGIGASAPAGLL